jgi:hypothetical protein
MALAKACGMSLRGGKYDCGEEACLKLQKTSAVDVM